MAQHRTYKDECSFIERLDNNSFLIKKGFVPNMKVSDDSTQCTVQVYVALGPRVKVIILNILPELKPDGLKFSLKIDLMSLAIIAK